MACHDDLRALAGLPQTVKQQTRCSGMKCNFGLLNANQRHARSGAVSRLKQRDKRSEEHTSELQSLRHLVCRLLLEKNTPKKQTRSEEHPSELQSLRHIVRRLL